MGEQRPCTPWGGSARRHQRQHDGPRGRRRGHRLSLQRASRPVQCADYQPTLHLCQHYRPTLHLCQRAHHRADRPHAQLLGPGAIQLLFRQKAAFFFIMWPAVPWWTQLGS